jgi:hypothetical protein
MHRLRFLQALALVSAAGCSTRSIDTLTGPSGSCVDKANSKLLGCAQGDYCTWNDGLDCQAPVDGSTPALAACGLVSCDTNHCTCSTQEKNVCECTSAVIGPLSPPDLPV